MILVDTSIWVDHLRYGDDNLSQLLIQGIVCCHPLIIGELACGNLQNRSELISMWKNLPMPVEASHQEALYLVESRHLMGKGIGYIDLHLLATCLLTSTTQLWTKDKRLATIADSLGIAFSIL